jgi:hypothetical protein
MSAGNRSCLSSLSLSFTRHIRTTTSSGMMLKSTLVNLAVKHDVDLQFEYTTVYSTTDRELMMPKNITGPRPSTVCCIVCIHSV